MQSLPIDSLLADITASLQAAPNLVIEAPPGAGKTTRVPPALLGIAGAGKEVWVLEPRRLAARMSARRVAEERGERLGETVGYQVRFEEVSGPDTRLRFLTEGVMTRRLLSNPKLDGVGAVVLDEFHERHLQADITLALLKQLQQAARPDLKIVAMSATLDAAPVARFLNDCPALRSEGRRFDVEIEHLARPDERPLAEQVASAVKRLVAEKIDGDILVFLPGAAEIRRAQAACADVAASAGWLVLPLHGDLPPAEQDRAVRPANQRKIILSTNVAETSVTIEGVVAVVDSGLARIAWHSLWSGLPTLTVQRISKAAAVQRAGRAGRTRAGRCLRLFTAQDFAARPDYETPEVRRLDLAEVALELHAAGQQDLRQFGWYEPPSTSAIDAAETLLKRLGAIDGVGTITELGRACLRFPLHPRQSRVLIEAERRGVAREACAMVALLGERDLRAVSIASNPQPKREAHTSGPSDLFEQMDLLAEAERVNFAPERLRAMNLNPGAASSADRVRKQLMRISRTAKDSAKTHHESQEAETALLISVLAGYPDRVARRKSPPARRDAESANEVLLALSNGGAARLAGESVVRQAEFLIAVEAEERKPSTLGGSSNLLATGRTNVVVRTASAIEPDWLLDLFADNLREVTEARFNAQHERVEVTSRLMYDQLVIDERQLNDQASRAALSADDEQKIAATLAEAALAAGLHRFIAPEEVSRFLARVEFARSAMPEANVPALGESDVIAALTELCVGKRSFAELKNAAGRGELIAALRGRLRPAQIGLLERVAPEHVSLTVRRRVRVNYEPERPPWIASRLQDFFGLTRGPAVAEGRVPLVLYLLAPNQRPVQVTTDLAGFWTRHYPQIRKELSRRYPRHAWPEDPLKPSEDRQK